MALSARAITPERAGEQLPRGLRPLEDLRQLAAQPPRAGDAPPPRRLLVLARRSRVVERTARRGDSFLPRLRHPGNLGDDPSAGGKTPSHGAPPDVPAPGL